MTENSARVLEDRDRLFIDILLSLGVRRQEAILIAWMNGAGEFSSKDIEQGAGLRQSDISKILRTMQRSGWIETIKTSNSTKGRPRKIYSLNASLDIIIGHYERQKLRESLLVKESIQRLKELAAA